MTRAAALLLLLAASPALGQPTPRLTVPRLTVLADSVWPGERVRVAVAVDPPAGRAVVFPDVPRRDGEAAALLAFGDAEALDVRRLPPRLAPRRGVARTDSAVYDVAVFASGEAVVGPVEVALVRDGDTLRASTGVARVPVRSRLGGEPPADVRPPPLGPPEAFPSPAPLLVAAGGLALLALGGLAVWLRRRRPPVAARAPAEPLPEALARLDAAAALPPEAAALEAREALRAYLRRRLGMPAPARATDETAALLAADPRVPDAARRAALRTFATADPAAYAAAHPDADDARTALADARAAMEAVEGASGERGAGGRRFDV